MEENKRIIGEYYEEFGSRIVVIDYEQNKKSALERMKSLKECDKTKNYIVLKVEKVADEIDIEYEIKKIDREMEILQNKREKLIKGNEKQ